MKKKRKNRSIVLSLLALWLVVCLAFSGGLLYYDGQVSKSEMELAGKTLAVVLESIREDCDPDYLVSVGIQEGYQSLEADTSGVNIKGMVSFQLFQCFLAMDKLEDVTANFGLYEWDDAGMYKILAAPEEGVWAEVFIDQYNMSGYCNLSDFLSPEELELIEGYLNQNEIPVLKNSLPILGMVWGGSLLLFGLVGGTLIVHNNHYEQRRAELEERRRQQARAVAHDLKTPLAVISAYAENISENLHPEKNTQYAGQILEATQRMNSGIQRLLQMDRVEGGRLSLGLIDLGQLTREVLRRYQQPIEEKNLTVRVEGGAQLTGDRELISQVIDNFLSNAVRYTPERGEIEIRLEEGKFSIHNQGKRIPEEKLSHIWEPYYQVEPERNPCGNGLGLTIAKAALDQHGFRCGVKNTGDGVNFFFTW